MDQARQSINTLIQMSIYKMSLSLSLSLSVSFMILLFLFPWHAVPLSSVIFLSTGDSPQEVYVCKQQIGEASLPQKTTSTEIRQLDRLRVNVNITVPPGGREKNRLIL